MGRDGVDGVVHRAVHEVGGYYTGYFLSDDATGDSGVVLSGFQAAVGVFDVGELRGVVGGVVSFGDVANSLGGDYRACFPGGFCRGVFGETSQIVLNSWKYIVRMLAACCCFCIFAKDTNTLV